MNIFLYNPIVYSYTRHVTKNQLICLKIEDFMTIFVKSC